MHYKTYNKPVNTVKMQFWCLGEKTAFCQILITIFECLVFIYTFSEKHFWAQNIKYVSQHSIGKIQLDIL